MRPSESPCGPQLRGEGESRRHEGGDWHAAQRCAGQRVAGQEVLDDAGGQQGEAAPDNDGEDKETAAARAWARRLPRWADEQWRSINAALGYLVCERGRGETREPP
jgi:hypothetical protein